MKRCIICRKTSVCMRLLWGVRNKKRARPRTRKEQQRRRGQSLNLFDLFEVDGQEQQIQPYLYVSCLISGLTCHMNQHDLGASLKSPALLAPNAKSALRGTAPKQAKTSRLNAVSHYSSCLNDVHAGAGASALQTSSHLVRIKIVCSFQAKSVSHE